MGKRYRSIREIASQTRRRAGLGPTLRSALWTWTHGAGVFIVLFAATTGYITLRGGQDVQSVLDRFGATWETLPADAQPGSIPALALGMRDADLKGIANE